MDHFNRRFSRNLMKRIPALPFIAFIAGISPYGPNDSKNKEKAHEIEGYK